MYKMVLKQKYVTLCGLGDWRELKEEMNRWKVSMPDFASGHPLILKI